MAASTSDGYYPGTTSTPSPKVVEDNPFDNNPVKQTFSGGGFREPTAQERKSIGGFDFKVDDSAAKGPTFKTAWDNTSKRRFMLSENVNDIQNQLNFPRKIQSGNSSTGEPAKYDYQIVPGDSHFSTAQSLENKLAIARAALGVPIANNHQTQKMMKYYMYNRFKTPDINLAHNKTITHVFFTRPDLNLLLSSGALVDQASNHSETLYIWKRNPDIFKLLTDYKRCDPTKDNFNLLLSQQVSNFDIKDETLTTVKAGKSWNDYDVVYGDLYSGRTSGEFTCEFTDTKDFDIVLMLKLWMTYIDNVARGAWSPSYNLRGSGVSTNYANSHVYSKTLDYAASAYVFKCAANGEDILYWSKYYGVFPTNTGANALSWSIDKATGDSPKLNITFAYSYKRDMAPLSLREFNLISGVDGNVNAESPFSFSLGHSVRPYVGSPFVSIVDQSGSPFSIRLKFKTASSVPGYNESKIYNSMVSRNL